MDGSSLEVDHGRNDDIDSNACIAGESKGGCGWGGFSCFASSTRSFSSTAGTRWLPQSQLIRLLRVRMEYFHASWCGDCVLTR
ncbi:hypothetical protein HanPSC8_Chr12g0518151 [Helianthus annuus]|nr:hypothetical protein HanPSC8_Chr12g0518151 [Helianthus annuus]